MLLPLNQGGFAGARRDEFNKVIISDTTLQKLLPYELQLATDTHKQLCGCELCLAAASLQRTLNSFCLSTLKSMQQTFDQATGASLKLRLLREKQEYMRVLFSVDGKLRHQKTKDALTTLTCLDVGDTGFPPWKCVMGGCLNCPKYTVPTYEDDILNGAPRINFTFSEVEPHSRSICPFQREVLQKLVKLDIFLFGGHALLQ
jgi:hypothetical protein